MNNPSDDDAGFRPPHQKTVAMRASYSSASSTTSTVTPLYTESETNFALDDETFASPLTLSPLSAFRRLGGALTPGVPVGPDYAPYEHPTVRKPVRDESLWGEAQVNPYTRSSSTGADDGWGGLLSGKGFELQLDQPYQEQQHQPLPQSLQQASNLFSQQQPQFDSFDPLARLYPPFSRDEHQGALSGDYFNGGIPSSIREQSPRDYSSGREFAGLLRDGDASDYGLSQPTMLDYDQQRGMQSAVYQQQQQQQQQHLQHLHLQQQQQQLLLHRQQQQQLLLQQQQQQRQYHSQGLSFASQSFVPGSYHQMQPQQQPPVVYPHGRTLLESFGPGHLGAGAGGGGMGMGSLGAPPGIVMGLGAGGMQGGMQGGMSGGAGQAVPSGLGASLGLYSFSQPPSVDSSVTSAGSWSSVSSAFTPVEGPNGGAHSLHSAKNPWSAGPGPAPAPIQRGIPPMNPHSAVYTPQAQAHFAPLPLHASLGKAPPSQGLGSGQAAASAPVQQQQSQPQPQRQQQQQQQPPPPPPPPPQQQQQQQHGGSRAPARRELAESPVSKSTYKEFCKSFRSKERDSAEEASLFAEETLQKAPDKIRWKVLLELADLKKRHNEFDAARELYRRVTELQPLAAQAWLDWSRMEEESGRLVESLRILREGLDKCEMHEGLLTKAIRQQEKLHKLKDARGMLSMLKHESIERVWKAVLEGALLEARAGRLPVARKLFKYLISHVPWYGPIYFEAFKLEEKNGNIDGATEIVRKGLKELPRYGPLWLGLLRLAERSDVARARSLPFTGQPIKLSQLHRDASQAVRNISRELIWKVFFELAQAEERAVDQVTSGLRGLPQEALAQLRDSMLGHARLALVRSALSCPLNLRWKVWLAGARIELGAGNLAKARRMLCQAFSEVPPKNRALVYLECSRVEEYAGNVAGAGRILARACREGKADWKVFLEAILMRARVGDLRGAAQLAEDALKIHMGTGRIWATLVQLCHRLDCFLGVGEEAGASARGAGASGTGASGANATAGATADAGAGATAGAGAGADTETEAAAASDRQAAQPVEAPLQGEDLATHTHLLSLLAPAALEPRADPDGAPFVVPNKNAVLLRALREVPKSGEVWCEGARCRLNPLSAGSFDPGSALKFLSFAIQFTPQYGDTFIEALRLEMLVQVLLPRVLGLLGVPLLPFFQRYLVADIESDAALALKDGALLTRLSRMAERAAAGVLRGDEDFAPAEGEEGDPPAASSAAFRRRRVLVLGRAQRLELDLGLPAAAFKDVSLHNLQRRCINADPNYGPTWFFCRPRSYDTPPVALLTALEMLAYEMCAVQAIYTRALVSFVCRCVDKEVADGAIGPVSVPAALAWSPSPPPSPSAAAAPSASSSSSAATGGSAEAAASTAAEEAEREHRNLTLLQAAHSRAEALFPAAAALALSREFLQDLAQTRPVALPVDSLALVRVGASVFANADFVSAVIKLNRMALDRHLSPEDRRRILFGSDQILP